MNIKTRSKTHKVCSKLLDHHNSSFGHWMMSVSGQVFVPCYLRHDLLFVDLEEMLKRELKRIDTR